MKQFGWQVVGCSMPAMQRQERPWASELILEWGVEEARPEGPRAGMRGQPVPPHQLGGLRERCKFPQRGPGRRVFLYFEPSDCLSQHLSTCCIQFAWLGIRFFF